MREAFNSVGSWHAVLIAAFNIDETFLALKKTKAKLFKTNWKTRKDLMRFYKVAVESFFTDLIEKHPHNPCKTAATHTLGFSKTLPSKTSSDFVNKVSNIHRQITHPTQDVTAEMKACVSLESFDSVSNETLTETVI